MQRSIGFYTAQFIGIVIMILAGLAPGCKQQAKSVSSSRDAASQAATAQKQEVTKIEPKAQETEKIIEQQLMTMEDTSIFKKIRKAEIICMSDSVPEGDTNASEPNIRNGWYVRIDGKPSPRYDGIGEIVFTPDGNHIAYAAKEGSKFHLIVDGNSANPEFDNIAYITYSPDGNHLAYGARVGDEWFVVLDGNAGPKYDSVSNFAFSPDSSRLTYAAGKPRAGTVQNGKKQTVVIDGAELSPAYDATGVPVFSNDSKRMAFFAQNNLKKFMVVDGKPDEIYDTIGKLVFSSDSQHYAYFAGKDNYKFLVLDGVAGTPFEFLPERDIPVFGPNDNRVAYRSRFEDNWFVVVNDQLGPFFDGIGDRSVVLSPDGKSCAYAAQKGQQWCVVVNDQPGPLYDGIAAYGPVFSPNGNHMAYGAIAHSKYFVVLDGQPARGYNNYLDIGNNSISFSPDSSHLIYKAKRGTKWYMVVDGQLGPAYDKLQFKPTFTDNAVEYLAQRDGWIFRCRRPFEGPGISKVELLAEAPDDQPVETSKPQPAVEKEVTVNEQRLMPLEDIQNYQRIAYISDNLMIIVRVCPQEKPDNLVFVSGGTFKNTESNYYGKNVSSFYIGKFEVTQKEWIEVMGSNPSKFKGDNLPVEMVSWYDCVEYCNKRSIKEGLKPYYNIDRNKKDPHNKSRTDDIKWTVTTNTGANGYRLPTEAEWEYASRGGQMSRSYIYSGSDSLDEVGWHWRNSGDEYLQGFWSRIMIENNHNQTQPVGGRESNELGLYDMSGNVREWCWDWYENNGTEPQGRVWKGGGWLGVEYPCELSFRATWEANSKSSDTGFRVCRSE